MNIDFNTYFEQISKDLCCQYEENQQEARNSLAMVGAHLNSLEVYPEHRDLLHEQIELVIESYMIWVETRDSAKDPVDFEVLEQICDDSLGLNNIISD